MFYNQVCKEHQKVQQQISILREQIDSAPAGKLLCSHQGNSCKWYHSDGHNKTYIPKGNRKLAEQLAMKKYMVHTLDTLLAEEQALTSFRTQYESHMNAQSASPLKLPGYRDLLSTFLKPVSDVLSDWAAAPFETNPQNPEHLIHKTDNGIFVRSKSEAMIAHFLYVNQIPFRYECALFLDKNVFYPDFTIRHPKTGELYYWEHFGLMDDPSYCKKVGYKIQTYSTHGIIPSINLITTYETENHPLTTDAITQMIQQFFL